MGDKIKAITPEHIAGYLGVPRATEQETVAIGRSILLAFHDLKNYALKSNPGEGWNHDETFDAFSKEELRGILEIVTPEFVDDHFKAGNLNTLGHFIIQFANDTIKQD